MLYFGFIQSLLNALIFWFRKPSHLSNDILAIWFLIFSLFFLGLLIPEGLTAYIGVGFVPFMMLTGPVFYFYVKSLIHTHFAFSRMHIIHIIPFILLSIFRLIYLPESLDPGKMATGEYDVYMMVVLSSLWVSLSGYWVATFVSLIRHQQNILNFFPNKSGKRSLNWVLFLMVIALLSYTLFFTGPYLSEFSSSPSGMTFWLHQFNMGMLGYLLLILMQHFTFLGVAYEAGFNSKSSFNRIFKEIKGQTPSQYRKSYLDSSTSKLS